MQRLLPYWLWPKRLALILLIASLDPTPAGAQEFGCSIPTTNEWLRQGDNSGPFEQLTAEYVRPVSNHLDEAIARLATRLVAPLTFADAKKFTGNENLAVPGKSFRPYLVRAVFPTPHPTFDIRWDGKRLGVVAGGLGCAPFVKHPIVVFLERKPRLVYVAASAAL